MHLGGEIAAATGLTKYVAEVAPHQRPEPKNQLTHFHNGRLKSGHCIPLRTLSACARQKAGFDMVYTSTPAMGWYFYHSSLALCWLWGSAVDYTHSYLVQFLGENLPGRWCIMVDLLTSFTIAFWCVSVNGFLNLAYHVFGYIMCTRNIALGFIHWGVYGHCFGGRTNSTPIPLFSAVYNVPTK